MITTADRTLTEGRDIRSVAVRAIGGTDRRDAGCANLIAGSDRRATFAYPRRAPGRRACTLGWRRLASRQALAISSNVGWRRAAAT